MRRREVVEPAGDAARASRHLVSQAVRRIDVGKVTFMSGSEAMTRYFANIAEAGLGAEVVARTATLPAFLGPAKYFFGFWLVLPKFHPAAVRVDADGRLFESRAHNVVVANCRFYGGGMQISRIKLEADPPFLVEADGEILGTTPATFEIVPQAIQVKV